MLPINHPRPEDTTAPVGIPTGHTYLARVSSRLRSTLRHWWPAYNVPSRDLCRITTPVKNLHYSTVHLQADPTAIGHIHVHPVRYRISHVASADIPDLSLLFRSASLQQAILVSRVYAERAAFRKYHIQQVGCRRTCLLATMKHAYTQRPRLYTKSPGAAEDAGDQWRWQNSMSHNETHGFHHD
jgi:hypothetical protein